MKNRLLSIIAITALFALILDTKCASYGAAEGISLCIQSVIPSLFPFLVLSSVLTSAISTGRRSNLTSIFHRLGIPPGGETILISALLGGYPVGAQCISQLYRQGKLCKTNASHLLSFCSNAGPAFVFGIVAGQFSTPVAPLLIWIIHILSALAVGFSHTYPTTIQPVHIQNEPLSFSQAMQNSVRVMAQICGWVILFRVLLAFLSKWLLCYLPLDLQVVISGLLELTNGCCRLGEMSSEPLRFVAATAMLSFGGVCVAMQTASVTAELGIRAYLTGKLQQTLIGILLSLTVLGYTIGWIVLVALITIILRETKNKSRNSAEVIV